MSIDGRQDIEIFLKSGLEQLCDGALVLDAGAGDPIYHVRVPNRTYFTLDLCVGDDNWNYNKINIVGDMEVLPLKTDSFDAIICSQVLEHMKEPQKVLTEMCRALKPGGKIFLTAPQEWGMHQTPYDYFRFTKFGLIYILEKAGFRLEGIEPIGGYFRLMALKCCYLYSFIFPETESKFMKIVRRPFKLLLRGVLYSWLPRIFEKLDVYDKKRDFTMGYTVTATKIQSAN